MKIWLVVIVFLFNQVAFAQCPEDIQMIQEGQVANCSGLLFSPDEARRVDGEQRDLKYFKELSNSLLERRDLTNKELSVLDKRLKLYMDQSQILAEEVYKKQSEDKWQKVIYFGLGVLATGISVYGASHLGR